MTITEFARTTPTETAPAPMRASQKEIGIGLVPVVRPLTRGGIGDLLALHRHHRRMRTRAA